MAFNTLSILIPAYNEERTIHLILDKVLAVDLDNNIKKEIVLVNDCSTDDTEGAISKYISEHPDADMKLYNLLVPQLTLHTYRSGVHHH